MGVNLYKKFVICLSVAGYLAMPVSGLASAKKQVEPKGAERARQYAIVLKDCRKRFGPSATAEWGGYYGETHWWCRHGM
jgi:hypothetical protein